MKTLVLGIGNTLLTDEGIGIHVLQALEPELANWPDVTLLDGGTLSFTLAGPIEETDALIVVEDGEVWLRNLHIPHYAPATINNHEPERPRKLLLHRGEIERLIGTTQQKGLTLIPTRIYFKGPRAKVELGLARNKEGKDRRREIADRYVRRDIEREFKGRYRS